MSLCSSSSFAPPLSASVFPPFFIEHLHAAPLAEVSVPSCHAQFLKVFIYIYIYLLFLKNAGDLHAALLAEVSGPACHALIAESVGDVARALVQQIHRRWCAFKALLRLCAGAIKAQ